MILTDQQETEIARQAAWYDTDDTPCAELNGYRAYPATERGDYPADAVAVDFTYLYADEDQVLGLETTVFAADGDILDTHDFG